MLYRRVRRTAGRQMGADVENVQDDYQLSAVLSIKIAWLKIRRGSKSAKVTSHYFYGHITPYLGW
jgi:hypothetical protein